MSDCNQATVSKIQPTGYPGFVQRGSNLNSWEVITKTFIIVGSHHILWQFLAFQDALSGSVFISSKCGKAVGSHGECMVLKSSVVKVKVKVKMVIQKHLAKRCQNLLICMKHTNPL